MTLESIALGLPVRVASFSGLDDADKIRLNALGLRPGVTVTKILKTPLRDPVECLVGAQLLALEARLLRHIKVAS
jgi:Fe2+ transport system protein FeoA